MPRGTVAWRRNAVIGVLLAVLILILQVAATHSWPIAFLSAGIAFVVVLAVLWVSDRYSGR